MASNDYYNQYNPPNTNPSATQHQYQGYSDRHDAPLPEPPTSPFDDRYAHRLPSPATPSTSGRLQHDTDPFADNNAIPLRNKYKAHQTTAPVLHHDHDDDFIRDAEPRRRKAQHDKKDGWFTGKITWCVYVLSFVQLVVFIAEIARNGKLEGVTSRIRPLLTTYRRAHQVSHCDPSVIQPNDWAVSVCAHQHGGTVSAMHACYA